MGKSCISSAVIQQAAVRERFPDGLAWVGLVRGSSSSLSLLVDMNVLQSQKPKMRGLQRRMFQQLTQKRYPKDEEGSAEEQQQFLATSFLTKTVLLIVDGEPKELRGIC